jgi:hypothetical protein
VDVEARERRVLERLRHDDRGRIESAPHVGNARSRPQLLDYAIQGRQPFADKVGGVGGTEEPDDAGEQPASWSCQPTPAPVRNASTNTSWSA